jgi:hypothetical protein
MRRGQVLAPYGISDATANPIYQPNGDSIMSDCNCKDTQVIPDFTKEGFSKKGNVGASNMISTASLHQQLAGQGVQALDISACVSATYNGSQICLNFPIIGNICFTAPISIPVNASLKACGSTCGSFIPTGLKITLYVNDVAMWSGVIWGIC